MASSQPVYSSTLQELWLGFCSKSSEIKKIDMDSVLPFIILPLLITIGALSFIFTIVVLVVIAMGAFYINSRPNEKNRSRFFFSWTLSSCLYMVLVFEKILLCFCRVTRLEHLAFLVLVICTSYFFYKMKSTADFNLVLGEHVPLQCSPVLTSDSKYCQICQIEVDKRFFHSIWFDCCILRHNYGYYLGGQIFASLAILYGTNLALTSICSPVYYGYVLLPNDCTLIYSGLELSKTYFTCIYALGYFTVINITLVQQIFVYFPKYFNWSIRK